MIGAIIDEFWNKIRLLLLYSITWWPKLCTVFFLFLFQILTLTRDKSSKEARSRPRACYHFSCCGFNSAGSFTNVEETEGMPWKYICCKGYEIFFLGCVHLWENMYSQWLNNLLCTDFIWVDHIILYWHLLFIKFWNCGPFSIRP